LLLLLRLANGDLAATRDDWPKARSVDIKADRSLEKEKMERLQDSE
jgi:hypothetical protein